MRKQWIVIIFLLFGLSLAACQPVQAMPTSRVETGEESDNQELCNLATLKGRYLFADGQPLLPPAFGVTQSATATNAGFHIFNGDGTGTDIVTFRINGETVLENEVVPISYTVNPDCTGAYTVLIEDGPTFGMFIAPSGEAIAVISTDPGSNVSNVRPRVSDK